MPQQLTGYTSNSPNTTNHTTTGATEYTQTQLITPPTNTSYSAQFIRSQVDRSNQPTAKQQSQEHSAIPPSMSIVDVQASHSPLPSISRHSLLLDVLPELADLLP